jgi:[ribosomal protein S5]-alanine N-acetyltransferase
MSAQDLKPKMFHLEWIDDLPVIVTERMVLHVSELDEVGKIVRYLLRNKEHLRPWEPKRDDLYFTEKAWEAGPDRDRHEARTGQAYRFRMLLKTSLRGEYIGTISLRDIRPWPAYHATIGYSLDHELEGQGLMTEGVEAVIRFGFEQVNLRRIEACFMPSNVRSERLLTSLGFQVEGLLRSSMEVDGRWEDHQICSLINHNWRRP